MRISDWSSDVCSSDLIFEMIGRQRAEFRRQHRAFDIAQLLSMELDRHFQRGGLFKQAADLRGRKAKDRKSVVEGKSVSVRVDLGGSRIIKKQKKTNTK